MPQTPSSLAQQVQRALGRARLVYWDDAAVSGRLQTDGDRLTGPLAVGAWAATDADREALHDVLAAIGADEVAIVDEHPDAQVAWRPDVTAPDLLPGRAVVAVVPDGAAPASEGSARHTLTLDLARAATWARSLRPVPGSEGAGEPADTDPTVGLDADLSAPLPGDRTSALDAPRPTPPPVGRSDERQWARPDAPATSGPVAGAAPAAPEGDVLDSGVDGPVVEPADVADLRIALAELAADRHTLTPLAVLDRMRRTLAETPRRGSEGVADELAAVDSASEERELDVAMALRAGELEGLDAESVARARALLAAAPTWGASWSLSRPTLDPDAELRHWRGLANALALPRTTRGTCQTLARVCERLLQS